MFCPAAHTTPKKRAKNSVFYRFNFNGQERDDEVYGAGNAYDYGARIHDPRLGRWFSIDPMFKSYPGSSNYSFSSNSPISLVDNDGNDDIYYIKLIAKDGTSHFYKIILNEGTHYRKLSCHGGGFERRDKVDFYWHDASDQRKYDRYTYLTIDLTKGKDIAEISYRSIFKGRPMLIDLFNGGIKVWGDGGDLGTNRSVTWNYKEADRPELDMSSDEWEALEFAIGSFNKERKPERPEKESPYKESKEFYYDAEKEAGKNDPLPDSIHLLVNLCESGRDIQGNRTARCEWVDTVLSKKDYKKYQEDGGIMWKKK